MGDAVLIEVRPYEQSIVHALKGAVAALPDTWTVHYWHGDANAYRVPSVVQRHLNASFPNEYRMGLRAQRRRGWWASRKWFNDILTSPSFWKGFDRTHLLLFQADTAFCTHPTASLSTFLRYTYIGAPWHPAMSHCKGVATCVGNCGLALFNVRDLRALVPEYHRQTKHRNFDIWLMHRLQHENLAPLRVALQFSTETLYNRSIVPFGVHNPFPHLSTSDLHHLHARCPAMRQLHNAFSSNW